jgi:cellulose biosynthesis protein BcsQ
MPAECEIVAAENESDFFQLITDYKPEAAVLFSEMFSLPIWEWIPKVVSSLSAEIPIIIVPLYKDEQWIQRIVEETGLQNTYVLSASLTYDEIRSRIRSILGFTGNNLPFFEQESKPAGNGKVYSLISYGAAGVTTFCINYPVLLAKRNPDKRIAVIDMNVEKPDLTSFFNLQHYQFALFRPDLINLKRANQRNWLTVFKQSNYIGNLFYASAISKWKSYEISNLVAILRDRFEYIYLDWGYCFPESEALIRMLTESDHNLFFVRADPFNIESATKWIRKWEKKHIFHQMLVSHFDQGHMNVRGIREGISVYGIVPRISDTRVIQSHQNKSVLVEEIFPPKQYIRSLKAIIEADSNGRGAAVSR